MVSSDNDLTDTTKYVDRIFFPKGTRIKIDGIPFWLESDSVLLGNQKNLSLIHYDKSLGVPSVLSDAPGTLDEDWRQAFKAEIERLTREIVNLQVQHMIDQARISALEKAD